MPLPPIQFESKDDSQTRKQTLANFELWLETAGLSNAKKIILISLLNHAKNYYLAESRAFFLFKPNALHAVRNIMNAAELSDQDFMDVAKAEIATVDSQSSYWANLALHVNTHPQGETVYTEEPGGSSFSFLQG